MNVLNLLALVVRNIFFRYSSTFLKAAKRLSGSFSEDVLG